MRATWLLALLGAFVLSAPVLSGEDEKNAERLLEDLESPDVHVRLAVAEWLSRGADTRALGEVIRAVRREEDARARVFLILALGRIGDRRAIHDLVLLLDDERVRAAALWSIRTILVGRPPFPLGDPDVETKLETLEADWMEKTRAWWESMRGRGEVYPGDALRPTPEQEAVLLTDLHSDDERVALRAAERLDSFRLTLEELRVQAKLLARHPHSWFHQALNRPLGTVDLPTLWEKLAPGPVFGEGLGHGRMHWAILPEHIPVLVDLLERAGPGMFEEYIDQILWAARDTDRFRLDAARGFLYALARLRAEREGKERPKLTDFRVEVPDVGLPEAFVALVRHRIGPGPVAASTAEDPASSIPGLTWLRHWAREVRPAKRDLPLLLEIARDARDLVDRAWAVRALGCLDDPAAAVHLREIAALDDEVAIFAAAERARDGEPQRFLELLERPVDREEAEMLAFEVVPDLARRRWIEGFPGRDPDFDWLPVFDPSAAGDVERAEAYGVRFREEDREALAAALPLERIPLEPLEWFLTEVCSSPLNGPRLAVVLDRLRELTLTEEHEEWVEAEWLRPLLAHVEVRAPGKLTDLLHHWVLHRSGALRDEALFLLGRMGDTRFVPRMIGIWPRGYDGTWLGRVRDPRVKAFLEEKAESGGPEERSQALTALGVFHGLPRELSRELVWGGTTEAHAQARKKLLEGDAVAAALLLPDEIPIPMLGLAGDPRAVEHLKGLRDRRENRWEAVAGLALAGDADARREIEGLVLDGRTWIFYPLQDGRLLTFGSDPAWIDFWVSRIDATCCQGFSALESLDQLFPTLRFPSVGRRAETKEQIAEWWAKHRGRFGWSRILDGWVPAR